MKGNNTREVGEYVDETHIVPLVQSALVTCGNVILRGETGTGKTFLVHWLSGYGNPRSDEMWSKYRLKTPQLLKFSCHEEQSYVDIVAQDVLVGGETKVRRQIPHSEFSETLL